MGCISGEGDKSSASTRVSTSKEPIHKSRLRDGPEKKERANMKGCWKSSEAKASVRCLTAEQADATKTDVHERTAAAPLTRSLRESLAGIACGNRSHKLDLVNRRGPWFGDCSVVW